MKKRETLIYTILLGSSLLLCPLRSTAQEKKDKDSNTIFSFRITNNNLSKSIDHD